MLKLNEILEASKKKSSFKKTTSFLKNKKILPRDSFYTKRLKSLFKSALNTDILKAQLLLNKIKLKQQIVLRQTKNNFFCSLIDLKSKRRRVLVSARKLHVKTNLNLSFKPVLTRFFYVIRRHLRLRKYTYIKLESPLKNRKALFDFLLTKISLRRSRYCFLDITPKKIFNGCQASKRIKKKRKYNRIIK